MPYSSEKEFVPGMFVKHPHENAPDFVRCRISVNRKELLEYLNSKNDDFINMDIKESKKGSLYAEIDNWKPTKPRLEGEDDELPF